MLLLILEIFISEKQDFVKIIITEKRINSMLQNFYSLDLEKR